MQSLLLDLDDRFQSFFPSSYARYNMFNNHFFDDASKTQALTFIAAADAVIVDPPFGGLMEPLAKTLRSISSLALIGGRTPPKSCVSAEIAMLLFFPYFLEV